MKSIRHTKTVFYYDGPQVFEARDGIGGNYVGVMVEPDGEQDQFLIKGVSPERLRQFRSGLLDLRELLVGEGDVDWFLAVAPGGFAENFSRSPKITTLGRIHRETEIFNHNGSAAEMEELAVIEYFLKFHR